MKFFASEGLQTTVNFYIVHKKAPTGHTLQGLF